MAKNLSEILKEVGTARLGVGIGSGTFATDPTNVKLDEIQSYDPDAIKKSAFLSGSKNQSALGKTIPYILGNTFFAPYTLNNGYYSIEGDDGKNQVWNVPLICGFNNQKLDSISIGSKKILDLSDKDLQDNEYNINDSELGEIALSVSTAGELITSGLAEKIIGQPYNEEVKHEHGKEAEPVIKELASNPRAVEVCIKFDGLRKYNETSGTYEKKKVKVVPYWSNNAEDSNPTWHAFDFDINNDDSETYEEVTLTSEEKLTAIENGKIKKETISISYGPGGQTQVVQYISNDPFYRVSYDCSDITHATIDNWTFYHKEKITSQTNEIERNTNETCRFVATYSFTPTEAYGKKISIKVVKETPTEENNSNETCILEYINTTCYDALKSTSSELVTCIPLENPYRDNTLRIGLKIPANGKTEGTLGEISIITTGKARVVKNGAWTTDKEPTRNPAAVALEILTSDAHNKSQFSDSEIDLDSFKTLYAYCEEEKLYCDGVITEGTKKRDLLNTILSNCFSDLVYNGEGKLSVVIDKKENEPVCLLNEQNITSIVYAKTFQRAVTGLKTTYTNRENWTTATEYIMRDGSTSYDLNEDTLQELSLQYVTTHDHAYKIAQRTQRQNVLQPRTITVNVGAEIAKLVNDDTHLLYKTVHLQTARFKQGLLSTTIHKVNYSNDGLITGFELADAIEFVEEYDYGIIVQAQNNNGRSLLKAKITGEGKTRTVTLLEEASSQYVIGFGNIASVGLLNASGEFTPITNVMKITDIKPGNNHGYELTLKDYNTEIYEYGTIPAYTSNLTNRPTTRQILPTLKAVDVDEAKYENWAKTKQLVAGLEAQIEGIVTETTVCSATVTNFVFDVADSGLTLDEQTISTEITLKHNDDELEFAIDSLTLPDGFTYEVVGKKITFTVAIGTYIKSGLIEVPVKYYPVLQYEQYCDENGNYYGDKDGNEYAFFTYGTTPTTWKLYFNYSGSGLCIYLGKYSSLSELPSNTSIGSYFVWAGDNRKTSALAEDGYFLQAQTYKFVGLSKNWKWEIDTNALHNQAALSDILSISNADLKTNNSTVWAYLDHLTSNSVYADMLVANKAFIANIAGEMAQYDLVTTDTFISGIDTMNANLSATKATLESEIEQAQTDAVNYVFSELGVNTLSKHTIIKNGYIDTGLLSADVVTTDFLLGGNAKFKGGVQIINGLALNQMDLNGHTFNLMMIILDAKFVSLGSGLTYGTFYSANGCVRYTKTENEVEQDYYFIPSYYYKASLSTTILKKQFTGYEVVLVGTEFNGLHVRPIKLKWQYGRFEGATQDINYYSSMAYDDKFTLKSDMYNIEMHGDILY